VEWVDLPEAKEFQQFSQEETLVEDGIRKKSLGRKINPNPTPKTKGRISLSFKLCIDIRSQILS
jgi:hypothetical protein